MLPAEPGSDGAVTSEQCSPWAGLAQRAMGWAGPGPGPGPKFGNINGLWTGRAKILEITLRGQSDGLRLQYQKGKAERRAFSG